jgi:hypothetical protein
MLEAYTPSHVLVINIYKLPKECTPEHLSRKRFIGLRSITTYIRHGMCCQPIALSKILALRIS